MKFWVGVTDNAWFNFLSKLKPDEVNFWQPGGNVSFGTLKPGESFLFKLHSPLNYIVGGGFFVRHSYLPLSLSWEAFERKNGAIDFESFRSRIIHFRGRSEPDPMIGCIILTNPFFFPEKEWIPIPKDWAPNIVRGKTYDTEKETGNMLWSMVQDRLVKSKELVELCAKNAEGVSEGVVLYGSEFLTRARIGQGAFRVLVTEAYERRCAISGERTLPVLESAHIKPYSLSGPHSVNNGILLRSDLHKLFDLGYLTITGDYHVEISKRIKEEYNNGREYYALHGRHLINLPRNNSDSPAKTFIEWHNENIYVP